MSKNSIPSQIKDYEKKTLNSSEISTQPTGLYNKDYYEESPYRFYLILAFFFLAFANGFQWVTFSSCASNFGTAYNLPSWKVNMFSLVYMIFYPVVCIPQAYLMDYYSTRVGIIMSSALTFIGALLKLFVNTNMIVCFLGQISSSLGQPAILDTPGKIAARWFKNDSRTLITSVLCLSNTVGILFGFVFFNFIIDSSIDPSVDPEGYKNDFYLYVFCEFLLNFAFCLPSFFISSDSPTYPTSPSQAKSTKVPYLYGFKLFFTNKRFVYLLMLTCCIIGYYNVFGTICTTVFGLYGVTEAQSSNIYGVSSGVGVVTAILFAIWVDKTKKFKLTMRIVTTGGVILQTLFTLFLELTLKYSFLNPYAIAMVMYTLVTMMVLSFYTIGMNYACELTYPLGECTNGALMMTINQLSGIAGTFFCEDLIAKYPEKRYLTNIVMLIFFIVACFFSYLLDDTLERNDVEESGITKYSY